MGPLDVDVMNLAGSVDIGQFDAHLHCQQSIAFVGPIDARGISIVDFDVELGQDFEVTFQIGSQDGLDDEEAKSLELGPLQVHQKVETRIGQE